MILSQSHQIDPLHTFIDCVVKSFILYSILAENEENLVQLLSSTCGNFHVSLAWTLLILLLLLERMFDFTKPSLSQVVMSTLNLTLIVDYYEGLLCEKVGDARRKI